MREYKKFHFGTLENFFRAPIKIKIENKEKIRKCTLADLSKLKNATVLAA